MHNEAVSQDKLRAYAESFIEEVVPPDDYQLPPMAHAEPTKFVRIVPGGEHSGQQASGDSIVPKIYMSFFDGGGFRFLRRALETAVVYGGRVVINTAGQNIVYEHNDANRLFSDGLYPVGLDSQVPDGLSRVADEYEVAFGLEEIATLRHDASL